MTCANVLVGRVKDCEGMEAMRLSVSLKAVVYFDLFQFTLPRRERPQESAPACPPAHFNPRSREGSDIRSGRGGQAVAHFNPRSREGSDAYSSAFWRVITNFNPRSREGSDAVANAPRATCTQFQSTLPRRERRRSMQSRAADGDFNPRSREGSDIFSRSLTIC